MQIKLHLGKKAKVLIRELNTIILIHGCNMNYTCLSIFSHHMLNIQNEESPVEKPPLFGAFSFFVKRVIESRQPFPPLQTAFD